MKYNDDLKINRTLQKIMIDKNIKSSQIADKLEKSRQVLSKQLTKQSNLTIDTIFDIADALSLDVKLSFIDRETGKVIEVE